MPQCFDWTPERDALLETLAEGGASGEEVARIVECSASTVYRRAKALKIFFDARSTTLLRNFLEDGGRLIREDVGGAVGIRWGRANRSGPGFEFDHCETFLRLGMIVQDGSVYRAPL